jgi:hypothetical protein
MDYSPSYSVMGAETDGRSGDVDRVELRQIRNVSEIINDTFTLVRSHPRFFLRTLASLALSPVLLATAVSAVFIIRSWSSIIDPYNSPLYSSADFIGTIASTLLMIPLLVLGYAILILVVHELVLIYGEKSHRQIEEMRVRDVWDRIRGQIGWMIGTLLVWALLLFFTLFLVMLIPFIGFFAVPVILIFTLLYFPLRIYDRRGLVQSFVASSKLVAGNWWKTAGLGSMIYLLTTLLTGLVAFPIVIGTLLGLLGIWDIDSIGDSPVLTGIVGILYVLLYGTGSFIAASFGMVSIILHFFSLTERKEARSLDERIAMIGGNGALVHGTSTDTTEFRDDFRTEQ